MSKQKQHRNSDVQRLREIGGLIYLASPYSHDDPGVRHARFQAVCHIASRLMELGINIFSPIAHTHPIAEYGLPRGWDFWGPYDRLYLEACSALAVAQLPGWLDSRGISGEIQIMEELGKPIVHLAGKTMNSLVLRTKEAEDEQTD